MNNTIKITARYSNLTAAVAATGMDLSYNEADARQTIRDMESDRRLKLVAVFADDSNQIWYVINSVCENLNLLHKFEPFFSCISSEPFNVMIPMCGASVADAATATELLKIKSVSKTQANRKSIAKDGLIAA